LLWHHSIASQKCGNLVQVAGSHNVASVFITLVRSWKFKDVGRRSSVRSPPTWSRCCPPGKFFHRDRTGFRNARTFDLLRAKEIILSLLSELRATYNDWSSQQIETLQENLILSWTWRVQGTKFWCQQYFEVKKTLHLAIVFRILYFRIFFEV